jgi:two-component system, NarL family, response regulator DesR
MRVTHSSCWIAGPLTTTSISEPIRLVLAEFEDIVSRGLRALIADDGRFALVASDVRTQDLKATLAEAAPDAAILNFGSLGSPEELRDLHAAVPGTRLVVLADAASLEECRQLSAFGASACLTKGVEASELLDAIHADARDRPVMRGPAAGAPLTQPESDVLELLRGGFSNAEIAATLHVGFETVRVHTSSIYRKLGVRSRRELRSGDVALAQSHHGAP